MTESEKEWLLNFIKNCPEEWKLVPLTNKQCFLNEWQLGEFPRHKLIEGIRRGKYNGAGVITGHLSGCIVAIDIDSQFAMDYHESVNTPEQRAASFTFSSGKDCGDGRTRYQSIYTYTAEQAKYLSKKVVTDGHEIRPAGGYSVLPGSIHPDTKQPYVFVSGDLHQLTPVTDATIKFAIDKYKKDEIDKAERKARAAARAENRSKVAGTCGLPTISSKLFLSNFLRKEIANGTKQGNRTDMCGRICMNLVAIENDLQEYVFQKFGREIILNPAADAEDIITEWAENSGYPVNLAVARLEKIRDEEECTMELTHYTDDHLLAIGNQFINRHEHIVRDCPDIDITVHQGTKKPRTLVIACNSVAADYSQMFGFTVLGIEDCRIDLCQKTLHEYLADYLHIHIVLPIGAIVNQGGKKALMLQDTINKIRKDHQLACKVSYIDYGQSQTNDRLSSDKPGEGLGYDPVKPLTANSRLRLISDDRLEGRVFAHRNTISSLAGEFYQSFVTPIDCAPEHRTVGKHLAPSKPVFGMPTLTDAQMGAGKTYASSTSILDGVENGWLKSAHSMVARNSLADNTMATHVKRAKERGILSEIIAFCPDSVLKAVNNFLKYADCTGCVLTIDEPVLWMRHFIEGGTFPVQERTKIQDFIINALREFLRRNGSIPMTQAGVSMGDLENLQRIFGIDRPIQNRIHKCPGLKNTVNLIDSGSNIPALAYAATLLKRGFRVAIPTYSKTHVKALVKFFTQHFPHLKIMGVCSDTAYMVDNQEFNTDVNAYLDTHHVDLLIYNGVMGTGVSIDVDANGKPRFDYVIADFNGGSTDDKVQAMMRVRGATVQRYAYINHANFGDRVKGEKTVEKTKVKFGYQENIITDIGGCMEPIVTANGDIINGINDRLETLTKNESSNPKKTFKMKLQRLHNFNVAHIDLSEVVADTDDEYRDSHAIDQLYKTCRQEVVDEEAVLIIEAPTNIPLEDIVRMSKKNAPTPAERGIVNRNRIDTHFPECVSKIMETQDMESAIATIGDLHVKKTILPKLVLNWYSRSKHKVDILTREAVCTVQMSRYHDMHTLLGRQSMLYRRAYFLNRLRHYFDILEAKDEFSNLDPLILEIYQAIRSLCPEMEQVFDAGKLLSTGENKTPYEVVKYVFGQIGYEVEETRRGVPFKGSKDTARWYKLKPPEERHFSSVIHSLNLKHKAHLMRPSTEEVSLTYFDCKSLLEGGSNPVNSLREDLISDLTGTENCPEVALDLWFAECRHIKVGQTFTLTGAGVVRVLEVTREHLLLQSNSGVIKASFRPVGI